MFVCCVHFSVEFSGHFRNNGLQSHFQTQTHDRLDELFKVMGFHHLVLLDENGKIRCDSGVEFIRETEGYPFTTEQSKSKKKEPKENSH